MRILLLAGFIALATACLPQGACDDSARSSVTVSVVDAGGALYAPDLPEPDLLIRTSGEMRLSNFLLWQLAYAEIVVTDTLWPDFRTPDLLKAFAIFGGRERRFGKTSAQLEDL